MKLWTIPEKWKAYLVLASSIADDASRMLGKLVRVFDDSELSLSESVELATEARDVAGKWTSKKSSSK